jgi:hypothetical protein
MPETAAFTLAPDWVAEVLSSALRGPDVAKSSIHRTLNHLLVADRSEAAG